MHQDKLEHQNLNDRTYAILKGGLISGTFHPGQVFIIRSLAERYGISTTPVREALQRLVAERLLVMLPNRTIVVPSLSPENFAEIYRIRCELEGLAGEVATAESLVEVGQPRDHKLFSGREEPPYKIEASAMLGLVERCPVKFREAERSFQKGIRYIVFVPRIRICEFTMASVAHRIGKPAPEIAKEWKRFERAPLVSHEHERRRRCE